MSSPQSIHSAQLYDFKAVYETIANETAGTLTSAAIDASPIVNVVQRSTTSIHTFYTKTVAQLEPIKQQAVSDYVDQLTKG